MSKLGFGAMAACVAVWATSACGQDVEPAAPPEPPLPTAALKAGLKINRGELRITSADGLDSVMNAVAGRAHRVDTLRDVFGLSGEGMWAMAFEPNAAVVTQHEAFGGRVIDHGRYGVLSGHATHVIGIIAADPPGDDPTKALARGMAPKVKVRFFLPDENFRKKFVGANGPIFVSNFSYGAILGWHRVEGAVCRRATSPPATRPAQCWAWYGQADDEEDRRFGKYTQSSRLFDDLANQRSETTMFVAAGNDREDQPPPSAWHVVMPPPSSANDPAVWSDRPRKTSDGWNQGGYGTVAGAQASAKNVITIGAMTTSASGVTAESVQSLASSAWGPTDDGRIKPDLVASGGPIYSTDHEDFGGVPRQDHYEWRSGTSMATPVATGIGVLLQELAQRQYGRALFADEMKAILIHTAVSPTVGPNYRTGWGAIDALEAGNVVASRLRGTAFRREALGASGFDQTLKAIVGQPIKATLVWLDEPGAGNIAGVDDPTSSLVRDLDLELVAPDGQVHAPWALDPAQPTQAAQRCAYAPPAAPCAPNRRDTVEQVEVPADQAVAGDWRVRVRGPAGAQDQRFALVVSGLE